MSGALGLEALHRWDDAITLNDLADWPRIKVDAITGLHSRAEPRATADEAVGRMGEIPIIGPKGGKSLSYAGRLMARNLDDLRTLTRQMQAAFAPDDERQMVVSQHPAYGVQAEFYWARCVALDIDDEQNTRPTRPSGGYERIFTLGLRMSDPRVYEAAEVQADTAALVQSAGITLPATLPFTIPAGATVGVANIDNADATAPSDPVIDLYGPVTNPTIENLTLGAKLRFTNVQIAAGSFLRIDFRARTIRLADLSDYAAALDAASSSWWDEGVDGIPVGASDLRYSGDSIADPAFARATYYPAHYA